MWLKCALSIRLCVLCMDYKRFAIADEEDGLCGQCTEMMCLILTRNGCVIFVKERCAVWMVICEVQSIRIHGHSITWNNINNKILWNDTQFAIGGMPPYGMLSVSQFYHYPYSRRFLWRDWIFDNLGYIRDKLKWPVDVRWWSQEIRSVHGTDTYWVYI